MTKETTDAGPPTRPDRREILCAAGGAALGGVAAALAPHSSALAQNATVQDPGEGARLGARLQGVPHFGLTVSQ